MVNFRTDAHIVLGTVIELKENYIGIILDNGVYRDNKERFEPIPITEEWFLKFGLVRYMQIDLYQMYDYPIEMYKTGNQWNLVFENNTLRVIKYVHEFQNLVFALIQEDVYTEFWTRV